MGGMKMKPFNFKDALDGKPMFTKDGQPAVLTHVICDRLGEEMFVARVGMFDGWLFNDKGESVVRTPVFYQLYMADDDEEPNTNEKGLCINYSGDVQVPFDLEKARKGATLCNRNGWPARFVCMDYLIPDRPVVVAVDEPGRNHIYRVRIDGSYRKGDEADASDIMMISNKKVGFMPISKNRDDEYCGGMVYETEDEARHFAGEGKYIDIVKVEFEDNA